MYFTAESPAGPGVFAVPASGGTARAVATGDPFRTPVGIASATDGRLLYVADTEAGSVIAVSVDGGFRFTVPGTVGSRPRGLEVAGAGEGAGDVLYLTGRDPVDGTPGVFKVPAAGGALATVAKGAPLVAPDAVAVTRSGDVYVTDRGTAPDGSKGAVFRIAPAPTEKTEKTERVADLRAPVMAGVALTLDESLLLVSSLSEGGTDEVLIVDLASGRTGTFSETIGENRSGAGLHRAHEADVFAWSDLRAGPDRSSLVYVLRA